MKHRFDHKRLRGEWHKYFISHIRVSDNTVMGRAREWLEDNIVDDGRCMIAVGGATMAIYIRDDDDAVLFELSHSLPLGVKRGKKVWV